MHTPTCPNDGTLGLGELLRGFVDLDAERLDCIPTLERWERVHIYFFAHGKNLRRDFDDDGARAASDHLCKCGLHQFWNVRRTLGTHCPLCQIVVPIQLVLNIWRAFLMARASDHQHGRGGGVGGCNARTSVVDAGTGQYQRGSNLATGAGITIRHVAGSLFVTQRDVADRWMMIERIHRFILPRARHAKDCADTRQRE